MFIFKPIRNFLSFANFTFPFEYNPFWFEQGIALRFDSSTCYFILRCWTVLVPCHARKVNCCGGEGRGNQAISRRTHVESALPRQDTTLSAICSRKEETGKQLEDAGNISDRSKMSLPASFLDILNKAGMVPPPLADPTTDWSGFVTILLVKDQ